MSSDNLPALTKTALDLVNNGKSISDVLVAIRPKPVVPTEQTVDLPKPFEMSDERRKSLVNLLSFLETSAVTPTERRELTEPERAALIEERILLDEVKKLIEERTASIRSATFNHLDIEAEKAKLVNDDVHVDAKGHYAIAGRITAPGKSKALTREVQEGAPDLFAEDMEDVAKRGVVGEAWTREDYLACTTPVRVADEAKITLHMRKKPEIVAGLQLALRPKAPVAKHQPRNA